MKILGVIMILCGCAGLGSWYRSRFEKQLKETRVLVQILELFAGEIRYGKASLPESCTSMTRHVKEPYRSGLAEAGRAYAENNGEAFGNVFKEQMERAMQGLPIMREDKEIFFETFGYRGFSDADMQLKSLERGICGLQDSIRMQESELREKQRMAMGLGLMGGMFLVILLA